MHARTRTSKNTNISKNSHRSPRPRSAKPELPTDAQLASLERITNRLASISRTVGHSEGPSFAVVRAGEGTEKPPYGGTTAAEAPRPTGSLESLANRLRLLIDRAVQNRSRIQSITDRTLGGVPSGSATGKDECSDRGSDVGELSRLLDDLDGVLFGTADVVDRLASL